MKKKGSSTRSLRGFAIILVLATLVLLAMLSLTYIKLALIDRNIARNYMDNKRAKLIAQSGVDYVIARMQEINPFDLTWQYDNQNPELNPSFKAGEVTINGQTRGYSQIAGSTYSANGDLFVLKIDDSQGKININDGLGNQRVSANLARIVNNIAKVIDASFPDLGDVIIWDKVLQQDKRPSGGYSNTSEIRKKLIDKYAVVGEDYYKKLKPFITTHAWQDQVVNPVPLSSTALASYPVKYNENIGRYRFGRGKDNTGTQIAGDLGIGSFIFGFDELNPQWVELVSRAPVNVNAAKAETLIALLWGLQGFFLLDERSSYPGTAKYSFCLMNPDPDPTFTYSEPDKGDIGALYTTEEIDLTLAQTIAQEIINCREKLLDYSDTASPLLWFRGPFKTWRQFNTFCDYLYEKGVINDSRTFSDGVTDALATVTDYAKKIAGKAKADVLKANFNSNLHLNESNPDANIATLVDKTDLIVNSTEFCFTPMGYFEIESEGLILRPIDSSDNSMISNSRITAAVKLYSVHRETAQSDFLNYFSIPDAPAGIATNSGRTLEIGPEPGHILSAGEYVAKKNISCGYIQLATLDATQYTNTNFLAHFSSDFTSYYINTGIPVSPVTTGNAPDPTEEPNAGPYIYSDANRLIKGYKDSSDVDTRFAPCDQRIDGVYLERHASLAYNLTTTTMRNIGHLSYWVKPSFRPGFTGKPRTYFSLSSSYIQSEENEHTHTLPRRATMFFGHYFLTSYWGSAQSESYIPDYYGAGHYYRTTSFLSCFSTTAKYGLGMCPCNGVDADCGICAGGENLNNPTCTPNCWLNTYFSTGYVSGIGKGSPILNHETHGDAGVNYFKQGQWTHVIVSWQFYPGGFKGSISNTNIAINGAIQSGNVAYGVDPRYEPYDPPSMADLLTNPLRIGEPALSSAAPDPARNWACDSTVDEFCIFQGTSITNAIETYTKSRYFRPANPGESSLISRELRLSYNNKLHPRDSTIPNPLGLSLVSADNPQDKLMIIGLSWTWYPEEVSNIPGATYGRPIIKNYRNYNAPLLLFPDVKVKLIIKDIITEGETELPEIYSNDSYSMVDKELTTSERLKYKIIFEIRNEDGSWFDSLNTTLLYSPIFDDITIYYSNGVEFLSYTNVD